MQDVSMGFCFIVFFSSVPPLCRGSGIDSIPKWSKQNKYPTQTILLENTVCVLLSFDFLFLLLSIPNFPPFGSLHPLLLERLVCLALSPLF
uniref:Putative secreted peptide n=1 Tax=Anopheles braziliensis TaxID=58242 RepID=A0A2M3ZUA6_9DIPT